MTIYAMEPTFLDELLENRKELLELTKDWSLKEIAEGRQEIIRSLSAINITPKNQEELAQSYSVDADGVAHIPIVGELTPKAEKDGCGGYTANALTEYGFIVAATQAADKDEKVKSITYDINSSGGYANGLMTAVDAIRLADKPTASRVQDRAASAAYFLAAQTDKIVAASPMTEVGSIGVAAIEKDDTKKLENQGITRRVYTSTDAPKKRPDTTTKEGQKMVIEMLDESHRIFVQYVADGRGTTVENVNKNFGRGGMLIADKALAAGMIDSIESVPSRREESLADVVGDNTAAKAEGKNEEVKMDNLEELKNEAPGLYAEAVKIGVNQEAARRAALDEQLEADPGNELLAAVIASAKADGKSVADVQTRISVAIREWKVDGETPPNVDTTAGLEPLSPEDAEAAKAAGMTADEYRKYSKEA